MSGTGVPHAFELALPSPAEMAEIDRRAVALGVPVETLMERAGLAVAEVARAVLDRLGQPRGTVLVLAGPGNNGGDGWVAARHLAAAGLACRAATAVSDPASLGGAAGWAARQWSGPTVPLAEAFAAARPDLVIDALFGAGLSRAIEGEARTAIETLNSAGLPVLAVDVPSGLDGATGEVRGAAVAAGWTVTFERRKPGHLLLPGRLLCGEVCVRPIGMPPEALAGVPVQTWANAPGLWHDLLPRPAASAHKYRRGHAVVVSGPAHRTGACRLAARGALRIGAGLVTVASPPDAVPVHAAHLTAIMIEPCEPAGGLARILADPRRNAVVVGPGGGIGEPTLDHLWAALDSPAGVVIDADGLTTLAPERAGLIKRLARRKSGAPVVLTPHEGEFARLFPELVGDRLTRARTAAALAGAVVLLKGPDTVIAEPDGRAAINDSAPPTLATAGSGDVLAGFVTGLIAQGMPGFEAAAAAVWLHGAAAARFGPGLIAEDLPEMLPGVLAALA